MTWIPLLALAVYAALKSGQLAFVGKASGYRDETVSLGRRLRTGEPALLIIAVLVTVTPALAGTWYHGHKFEAVLRHSVKCYGLIQAYRDAPEIRRSSGEHAVYESFYGYRWTAIDASRQIGLSVPAAQRQLDDAASSLAAERRHVDKNLRSVRLSEMQRCLHPPSEPPNA